MFKNMVMYRIAAQWQGDLVAVEQALQQALFSPCSATQEVSDGPLLMFVSIHARHC